MISPASRFRSLLILVAALIALSALIAGCGGSDADPETVFDETFSAETASSIDSAVIDASLGFGFAGGGTEGQADLTLSGPIGPDGVDLTVGINADGDGESLDFAGRLIATKTNLFVEYEGTTYELGEERFQRFQSFGGDESVTPDLSGGFLDGCRTSIKQAGGDPKACDDLNPSLWLGEKVSEGSEDVGGVATDHVSATIDAGAMIGDLLDLGLAAGAAGQNDLPPGFNGDAISAVIGNFIKDAKVDVYAGQDDGLLRKLDAGFKIETPDGGGTFSLGIELTGVNEEQEIAAPSGDIAPISDLVDQLPAEIAPALECILDAESQEDITACSSGLTPTPAF